ncbi:MAG: hypothetical protein ABID38_03200 [Candidatus Diapherotrites archaeon]
MPPNPHKPVMFEVDHALKDVDSAEAEFREAIKGKRALYIELTGANVDLILKEGKFHQSPGARAYQQLVKIAHEAGLRVIALDISHNKRPPKLKDRLDWQEREDYDSFPKREKRWLGILRNAGLGSIIVMHPGHAFGVAQGLGLPKENILRGEKYAAEHRERMMLDARFRDVTEKVESGRLERKRERAKARKLRTPRG